MKNSDVSSTVTKRSGGPYYINLVLGKPGGLALILILACIGVYFFGIRGGRFFLVPSASMEPTLMTGDYVVTVREAEYQRGDIVVFRSPEDGGYIVKRIAGLGGDELMVAFGGLYINGLYASEPYIREAMIYSFEDPFVVPPGEVFYLGDNRNYSEDSSTTMTTKPLTDIVGKVIFRYYPYERSGKIRSYPLKSLAEI